MSIDEELMTLRAMIEQVQSMLRGLTECAQVKEFYDIDDFARMVGRAAFTVREWARHKRIQAVKKLSGRGKYPQWVVSHSELLRYRKEGLLPQQ